MIQRPSSLSNSAIGSPPFTEEHMLVVRPAKRPFRYPLLTPWPDAVKMVYEVLTTSTIWVAGFAPVVLIPTERFSSGGICPVKLTPPKTLLTVNWEGLYVVCTSASVQLPTLGAAGPASSPPP